jgi:hypothetical protein
MWVLLIFMWSASGDFVSKIPVIQQTESQCRLAAITLPTVLDATDTRLEGICVTHDHWTGKKYMPDMPLEPGNR